METAAGWAATSKADLLIVVYLDARALFALELDNLLDWLDVDGHADEFMPGRFRHGMTARQVGQSIPWDRVFSAVGGEMYPETRGAWQKAEPRCDELQERVRRAAAGLVLT
jgi:hypothetical protein